VFKKLAGMEETGISDSATGLPIYISTTTRLKYRYIYRNNPELGYSSMRNARLNEIIAKDFVNSSGKVVHHFKLGKKGEEDRGTGEIRNRNGTVMFFISAIKDGQINILTLQSAWKSPKYTATHGIRNKKK
jgi:hypothetical protein